MTRAQWAKRRNAAGDDIAGRAALERDCGGNTAKRTALLLGKHAAPDYYGIHPIIGSTNDGRVSHVVTGRRAGDSE